MYVPHASAGASVVVGAAVVAGATVVGATGLPAIVVLGGPGSGGSPGTVAPAGIRIVPPTPGHSGTMPFGCSVQPLSVFRSSKLTLNFDATVDG